MILTYLMKGIDKSSEFGKWLNMKEPNSLEKFYKKADEFIRLESRPVPVKAVLEKAEDNTVAPRKNESVGQKRENNNGKKQSNLKKPRSFKPSEYTPLSDMPEHIYLAIKDSVDLPKPIPLRTGKKAIQSGKFCRFHNQPGHETDECRQLKNLIEELLRENKLQQFVKKNSNNPASSSQGQQVPVHQPRTGEKATGHESGRPVINVITGGPHPAGKSWGEMERYSRALKYAPAEEDVFVLEDTTPLKQQKTFSDDIIFRARDSTGIEAPTLDPLVISAGIGPAIVRRVLIDCGASCNILFKKTFDQMKIPMIDVQASSQKIAGFTGEPKQPIGTIDLLVELGEGERKVVRKQTFVIVDEFSAYNAFLGRPTLAAFKAILAPWCLTIKFPTDNGVGVIKGDQNVARECYWPELRESRKREMGKGAATPVRIKEPAL